RNPRSPVVPRLPNPQRKLGQWLGEHWRLMHMISGATGGLVTTLWLFGIPPAANLSGPGLALSLAAAPIAAYQGWALRRILNPVLWPMLVLFLALPVSPYLLYPLLVLCLEGGQMTPLKVAAFFGSPALVALVWVAPLLFLPVIRSVRFHRWLASAGTALAI